jgi:hypothetical protein
VTTPGHRRSLAAICVVAALASQIALPAMHALVHALEEAVQRAHAKRWRVEGARAAGGEREEHGHGHRHEHPGDRRGEHGANAPEHLTLAILQPEAPAIPTPAEDHQSAAPPPLRSIATASAPVRDHGIRGPPSRS